NIFRDGDKNVSGILQPTHALDTADMLINDEAFRGQFLNKAYNGKSILIKLLQENPKFRELFKVHQVALTAMK
ncbi:MAG: hypothetical protein GWN01_08875, partial [Nitrosopumilaceae archaeon]|nr:hypothetical protein [Nitrosopumilaceae archaeon]NIU87457.1 hypothetical protein [Nitrosopumilaceae archaeon]NIX61624.1 hypothetical protein [Nitrosopumilaceae archaeon]